MILNTCMGKGLVTEFVTYEKKLHKIFCSECLVCPGEKNNIFALMSGDEEYSSGLRDTLVLSLFIIGVPASNESQKYCFLMSMDVTCRMDPVDETIGCVFEGKLLMMK